MIWDISISITHDSPKVWSCFSQIIRQRTTQQSSCLLKIKIKSEVSIYIPSRLEKAKLNIGNSRCREES